SGRVGGKRDRSDIGELATSPFRGDSWCSRHGGTVTRAAPVCRYRTIPLSRPPPTRVSLGHTHQCDDDLLDGDGSTPSGPAGIPVGDDEPLPALTRSVPAAAGPARRTPTLVSPGRSPTVRAESVSHPGGPAAPTPRAGRAAGPSPAPWPPVVDGSGASPRA